MTVIERLLSGPSLLTVADVRQLPGLGQTTLKELRRLPAFPRPYASLSRTMFSRTEVVEWWREHGAARASGHPALPTAADV